METRNLEEKIISRGKEFFQTISQEKPSLFNKAHWMGKIMDWCMQNEDFKVQMFRFVDVFPSLETGRMLTGHIREYFGDNEKEIPAILKLGARMSGIGGVIGGKILGGAIKFNIKDMARQFIVGDSTDSAIKNISKLRKDDFAFVVDVLGEATVSENEAEQYTETYIKLIEGLKSQQAQWPEFKQGGGDKNGLDWGYAPKINVSVKPSAFYSQAKPQDFEGSVVNILSRLKRVYGKIVEAGGFLCIDMESYKYKGITLEVFRRLRSDKAFADCPHLGIALQAYLKDNDRDVDELISWARKNNLGISIRLVKGAYWDYETVIAKRNGWEVPVYTHKPESDIAFERQAKKILENHDICHLACASHNIRSISAVLEIAKALGVPESRYEFQVLYGMAEPVRKSIRKIVGRVRLYCPYGQLVPGMAYLVRRLLENTANESFLRQSFAEEHELDELLEDPRKTLEKELSKARDKSTAEPEYFRNFPSADFTKERFRQAFPEAIKSVRRQLGKCYPLFINGRDVTVQEKMDSVNPANPSEILGSVCQAGTEEVVRAISAAKAAFGKWRDRSPQDRADFLFKAAEIARGRVFELAAWQVLEVGKQWDQAYADVTECIDFFGYYAREMMRLGKPQRLGHAPGEVNLYFYQPKGVAAVISPWNFPIAISGGMCSAALVAGNCVVFKPSGLSSIIGHHLVEIFKEAGIPDGVFNYVPGRGSVIGDFIVEHPDISLIAFTGSVETGCRIIEKAAKVQPGQPNVKKVVCEMGGKNAIIIDDDADLDEAVPHVLYSAFGFQGQKCSACSRVIVLDAVYDRFVNRLVKGAESMKIGPSENPANSMGPVVDKSAQEKILEYIGIGKKEGEVLYQSRVPDGGFYVPMTIIAGIKPDCRIAQEEIFGPVLAVMRVKDFDEAIEYALSTKFALTGGVFSRSPKHLAQASKAFRVGNLYLNRNCVGALVGRQPFGGAAMSGVGTKAGGPDYLLHFMDPRTVTENTMRRGFTPVS